jgi:hypothetical protein
MNPSDNHLPSKNDNNVNNINDNAVKNSLKNKEEEKKSQISEIDLEISKEKRMDKESLETDKKNKDSMVR